MAGAASAVAASAASTPLQQLQVQQQFLQQSYHQQAAPYVINAAPATGQEPAPPYVGQYLIIINSMRILYDIQQRAIISLNFWTTFI